jgi:hypothetical protein
MTPPTSDMERDGGSRIRVPLSPEAAIQQDSGDFFRTTKGVRWPPVSTVQPAPNQHDSPPQ